MNPRHYLDVIISAFALSLRAPLAAGGGAAGVCGGRSNGFSGHRRKKIKGWQKLRRKG